MGKRSQKCRDEQGAWDCGAGAMEFGETFEETVRREVREEYGVEPIEIQQVGIGNILRNKGDIPTHWIKIVHLVLVDPSRAQNGEPEKIDEIGWFPFDNLPQPLHSQVRADFDLARSFLEVV